ncbi:MAG: hypothetical protein ABFQ82_04465 [Thermodesulfobacteriota bacterium]
MSQKNSLVRRLFGSAVLFVATALFVVGCGGKSSQVRHLSSDVCLVMPDSTTRQEVLSFLGEPDRKISKGENRETWFYLDVSKSFSKRMPLVGEKLGSAIYETVTVTFEADLVRTCFYRHFDKNEFEEYSKDLGLK